jgi:hypothetical protein
MKSYWLGWRYIKLALLCGASGGDGLAAAPKACISERRRNAFLRRWQPRPGSFTVNKAQKVNGAVLATHPSPVKSP